MDPDTPVVVGVAAVSQRCDDPADADEAIDLLQRAVEGAIADSGAPPLVDRIRWIGVPEGAWRYGDPGRMLARRFGLSDVTTVRADVGVTQQELLARACLAVQQDGAGVAVVAGGEAKYRALRAAITGVEVSDVEDDGVPDEVLSPESLGMHDLELIRNTVVPSTSYALFEHALAHDEGLSPEAHRDRLGSLWSGFAAVAVDNPDAWDRTGWSAADIVTPSAGNRMIATPYTKLLCSQWNVDQAGALVICSVDVAEALGIGSDRWVFPHSSTVANHAVPVVARSSLGESPGARVAGERALSLAGLTVDAVDVVDLYSCFPAAVQVLARELGLALDRPLTVTGGMTFAGGPLNNYVVQAMVRLVNGLRAAPGQAGLSSSVSGWLTKQGCGLWSARPPAAGFRHEDCTAAVAAADEPVVVDPDLAGDASIVSWTVVHDRGEPAVAVALVEAADRRRSIATSGAGDLVTVLLDGDWIGEPVHVHGDGSFDLAGE